MSNISEEAKAAAEMAFEQVRCAIRNNDSFKMEAGAGAGKTYTLIEALKFLIEVRGRSFAASKQQIACITFTNVAKDEIIGRIDRNPVVHCNTIHGFCWENIQRFQKALKNLVPKLDKEKDSDWEERIEECGGVDHRKVSYIHGYRSITDDAVMVSHDDIIRLAIELLDNRKFRNLFRSRYPVILIDEYQDTDEGWVNAIKTQFFSGDELLQFGFFGDHWQKIYGNGCGNLDIPSLRQIEKKVNFRSAPAIVDCLNRMRPQLLQEPAYKHLDGQIRVFHTNEWDGQRRSGHFKGDLPEEEANRALDHVKACLQENGWNFDPIYTKILMLTHRALAQQQDYSSIPSVFKYNDSFTNKTQPHISYFVEQLEPAARAYVEKRFGDMFDILNISGPYSRKENDKMLWIKEMDNLVNVRENGTVNEVISFLENSNILGLPESIRRLEADLDQFDHDEGDEMPRTLEELQKLRVVPYREISNLCRYLDGHSPFQTKHGVKGAEYQNVLVVVGRGWTRYNFDEMLANYKKFKTFEGSELEKFERNRNLFYVSCSRPKERLSLLFTQELSSPALATIEDFFGSGSVEDIGSKLR